MVGCRRPNKRTRNTTTESHVRTNFKVDYKFNKKKVRSNSSARANTSGQEKEGESSEKQGLPLKMSFSRIALLCACVLPLCAPGHRIAATVSSQCHHSLTPFSDIILPMLFSPIISLPAYHHQATASNIVSAANDINTLPKEKKNQIFIQ